MVDHDAVAFVKELLGEDHCAGVSGEDWCAGSGAEVGAFVDAGEFAVEGAAGAEAVRGCGFDGDLKVAGPEGIMGAVVFGYCEGLLFGFRGCFDEFLVIGTGFDEFGFDGDGAGVVVGGADGDIDRQVARLFLGICGDFQAGWAGWRFDIDAGEGEPRVCFYSLEEVDLVPEPFAFDLGKWVRGVDADQLGRAGLDDGWGDGDGLGVEDCRKRE